MREVHINGDATFKLGKQRKKNVRQDEYRSLGQQIDNLLQEKVIKVLKKTDGYDVFMAYLSYESEKPLFTDSKLTQEEFINKCCKKEGVGMIYEKFNTLGEEIDNATRS